jgi:TPR repeat protein
MKANRLKWFLLFLLASGVFQLPAQQSEEDRKLLADIRAKAEKGDAQSQFELGNTFYFGNLRAAKDKGEAVKWYRKAAEQNDAQAQYNLGSLRCICCSPSTNQVRQVRCGIRALRIRLTSPL